MGGVKGNEAWASVIFGFLDVLRWERVFSPLLYSFLSIYFCIGRGSVMRFTREDEKYKPLGTKGTP